MTIQQILNTKGADVIAIDRAQSVNEAVQLMDERQIGALVVNNTAVGCQGIFTERDVMRALARTGVDALAEPVSEHMTERPMSVSTDTKVEQAMQIMTEKRFRHLPIMTGTSLCGIVSIGDLVNYRIKQTEREASALKQYIASS